MQTNRKQYAIVTFTGKVKHLSCNFWQHQMRQDIVNAFERKKIDNLSLSFSRLIHDVAHEVGVAPVTARKVIINEFEYNKENFRSNVQAEPATHQ